MKKDLTLENYREILKDRNHYDWYEIIKEYKLSEPLIRDIVKVNKGEIFFDMLSTYQELSLEFIKEHIDNFNMLVILFFQESLNEELINANKDKFIKYMKTVPKRVALSEDFIEQNMDLLDKEHIEEYQVFSDSFAKKHNLNNKCLKTVFHYGNIREPIYRERAEPDIIYINQFKGTYSEALTFLGALDNSLFSEEKKLECLNKINECFRD